MKIEHRVLPPPAAAAAASAACSATKRRIGYTHPRLDFVARSLVTRGQRGQNVRVCTHIYIYICTYISRYWVALARSTYTYTASRTSNRPRVQSCPPAFTDTTWGEGDVVSWCSRTPGFHGLYRNFGCLRVEGGGSGCAHTRLIYVNWRWRWRWRCTRARARVRVYVRVYMLPVIPMYTSADRRGAGFVR